MYDLPALKAVRADIQNMPGAGHAIRCPRCQGQTAQVGDAHRIGVALDTT